MTVLPPTLLGKITAQETHFLIGLVVVLGATLFFPGSTSVLILAPVFLMVIVLWKEAWLDPRTETAAPFLWNGAIDASMYLVGIGVGLGLLRATGHLG